MTNSSPEHSTHNIIIQNNTSNAFGITSFILGLISIFIFAPVFVPLSLIFGIIAILRKQLMFGVMGVVCSIIGFITSPVLLGLFSLLHFAAKTEIPPVNNSLTINTTINKNPEPTESNTQSAPSLIVPQKQETPRSETNPKQTPETNASISTNSAAVSPSFDCSKTQSLIDKKICSNENLSYLDNQMASLYKSAIAHTSDTDQIKKAQKNWLKNYRNKCSDNDACLEKEYLNRINELNSMLSTQ